jgi:hypothetical protein
MEELWQRTRQPESASPPVCRGTLISREQYLVDLQGWGYQDAREVPHGRMTSQQIRDWTDAIWADKVK